MRLPAAIRLAVEAHAGQVDKQGQPYFLHPLRVMDSCRPDEDAMIVAVLHDVIEDTPAHLVGHTLYSYSDTLVLHVAEEEALRLVTRPGSDTPNRPTYRAYIRAIADAPRRAGEIARMVKWFDIRDNYTRSWGVDPSELAGLRERYEEARKVLRPRLEADGVLLQRISVPIRTIS